MGFWAKLIGNDEEIRDETPTSSTTEEVTPPVGDVLLEALLHGETITREKALTLPAVSSAVDFISNTIAAMPVKLYKIRDGKIEEQDKDTRVKLLNGDTGDTLDAFQMKKAMVEDYLLGKGGYCFIQRKRNDVVALRYVEDIYITVLKNFQPIYKDFEILVEGQSYKPYEFLKILRNTKDGASGIGLTVEINKLLQTAFHTLLYQLNLVESGGNKKGFLQAERKLGQSEINDLKRAWSNMYKNNSENVVVLNNGIKFQESSNTSVEMQLDQNKKTLEQEIDNVFHICDDWQQTFKEAIYPIVRAFETALNRDLLLEKEKKNHFFELDVKEILRVSIKERYEAYKLAKETGFMTLNEIRRAENLNYVEGLDIINVGLGAVLYDTNLHEYYTPNTGQVGDLENGTVENEGSVQGTNNDGLEKMLENHELAEAYDESGNSAEREQRENPNHDSKTGRFTTGSGGGSSTSSGNEKKIAELKQQMNGLSHFGSGAAKRKELQKQIDELQGSSKNEAPKKAKTEQNNKAAPVINKKEEDKYPVTEHKQKQFDYLQKTNPMRDDIHTGIRKASDIKSAQEAFKTKTTDDDFLYPDFTSADAAKALKNGKITVYSSKPIENGGFVSPSKMMASDYAGGKKVYSKEINVDDIAWIDSNEGQFAKV